MRDPGKPRGNVAPKMVVFDLLVFGVESLGNHACTFSDWCLSHVTPPTSQVITLWIAKFFFCWG